MKPRLFLYFARYKVPGLIGKTKATRFWPCGLLFLVEISGIEPLTSWMPFKRSPSWAIPPCSILTPKWGGTKPREALIYQGERRFCHCVSDDKSGANFFRFEVLHSRYVALPAELYPHVFGNPWFHWISGLFDFSIILMKRCFLLGCLRYQMNYSPIFY